MSRTILPGLQAPDPVFEAQLQSRLDEVEAWLAEATRSDSRLVDEAASHLLAAGGKRFRPMLALLAGHFGDAGDPRLVRAAVAVELTHAATLYHDDVIDEADSRRGRPSANARWGNTVAILAGDFLFARASSIAAALGSDISRILADAIARVCEGQIREVEAAGSGSVDEATYMDVIDRKTAGLIATSCRLGGILSGCPDEVVATLERYGQALGLAFQLSDDIMDLVSDQATLGKEPGVDVREGVYTLPVILALRDSEHRAELERLLAVNGEDPGAFGRALEIVRSDGALDRAREAVTRQVRAALAEAATLPEGPARDTLEHLARFLATRCGAVSG